MRACMYSTACDRGISKPSLFFHFALFSTAKHCSDNCATSSSSSVKHRRTRIDPSGLQTFRGWRLVMSGGCFACCFQSTIAGRKKS